MQLALDLTEGISAHDRFTRLLTVIKSLFHCDASALLAFREQHFAPLAINGMYKEVMGRQFDLDRHPRLEAIARAGDIVRFPHDSDLPDPYDGLIPNHDDQLHVHACIGLPLIANDHLIGALTIDGFDPHQFDQFSDDELRIVSALAAASLHNALLMEKLEQQAGGMGHSAASNHSVTGNVTMIGQSVAMQQLQAQISAVAKTDLTVLITGETGVGKELVAASIHGQSLRKDQPLVYLNCAALPESVAESELFGHVKGAFTGAISDRKGKFEMADGGTLFLDEIGELPLGLQAKLLRVLQYGDVQRVGADKHIKVNTRIVAATNRLLHEEVTQGKFRADLYHRLSVFPISAPPLRERGEDVILLAGYFIERCKAKLGIEAMRLRPDTTVLLKHYSWPGNVRELEHAIHRAAVVARASNVDPHLITLAPEHFDLTLQDHVLSSDTLADRNDTMRNQTSHEHSDTAAIESLKNATDDFQRQLIAHCYQQHQNWAATARQLGVDTGNLHRLAKRLGLK
ncbi:functional role page for anaerobic nitric oxide reductase transcription regulator NorR [Photobacterium aphoticum]|uniref:Functional role page for anaerobic nitric oxide reductase transcription regulator NorR n=1 Tax=Photobacterium aphoticum TaxID=754436 RepID=A0A090QK25_9GAMM|nr:functional role page for anaerobic nitric oxide reductase transcription regulator NorR [Photobacterium aphoticum]